MIKTAMGLVLLLSPFLMVRRFPDRRTGFYYAMAFSLTFQMSVAIFTQALHVFTYPVVLAINLAVFIIALFKSGMGVGSVRGFMKSKLLEWKMIKGSS